MTAIPLKSLETYAFCDPASGKHARQKKRRARQAIIVAARDWYARWFVLYEWAGFETASQFLTRILNTYEEYQPRRFGIEANGMQVLFGSLVQDAARERFGAIRLFPVYQPTNVEKTFRIRTGLEPVIMQGRLFLRDKTSPLAVELRGFPTAATMDLVDALESTIRIAPKLPEQVAKSEEAIDYARYLRQTGCPPHLIETKLKEFESTRNAA